MATAGDVIVAAPKAAPGDGADLLGELARRRGIEGPVPAVVGPRRQLVDEQLAVGNEQLDGQNADVVEGLGDLRTEEPVPRRRSPDRLVPGPR